MRRTRSLGRLICWEMIILLNLDADVSSALSGYLQLFSFIFVFSGNLLKGIPRHIFPLLYVKLWKHIRQIRLHFRGLVLPAILFF